VEVVVGAGLAFSLSVGLEEVFDDFFDEDGLPKI
jgi:hypothetical protein